MTTRDSEFKNPEKTMQVNVKKCVTKGSKCSTQTLSVSIVFKRNLIFLYQLDDKVVLTICGSDLHHHKRPYNFSLLYVIRLLSFLTLNYWRPCAF